MSKARPQDIVAKISILIWESWLLDAFCKLSYLLRIVSPSYTGEGSEEFDGDDK